LALSVDVEGFAESHAQSVAIPAEELRPERSDAEIARNLDLVLELLARHDCRATFFFLGRIARTAPALVRRVAEAGHEIGCHSLYHHRLTGQSPEEFREAVRAAKAYLEEAGGRPVLGFRAPDFSIVRESCWALDELLAAGFAYDSSVVPTTVHDVYGMADIPRAIFRWPNGLVEFPLPVVRFGRVALPIGGGGYFRLYPLFWTRWFLRRRMRRGVPTVFYIHPYEVGPHAPRLTGLSATRRFRHYVRLGQGYERLGKLLSTVGFTTMADVLVRRGMLPKPTDATER
jgi:polysaccharide deacetylase family protein (PEP-CTERM system associated)